MGCHILDPVFTSLALTAPLSLQSEGGAPSNDNWGIDSQVRFVFPRTRYTAETLTLHWYDGGKRPPEPIKALIGERPLSDQGSIYIGTEGVLYSPYIDVPGCCLLSDSRTSNSRTPAAPIITSSSSRPAAAMARPQPPSTTPAH